MAHRLLLPPQRRMEGQIRLPMIQDIGGSVTRRWYASLRTRDSLRTARTNTPTATGPMPSPQRFVVDNAGGPNAPDSMASGLRQGNAARLVNKTRGQSAGV
jgi:hypothetical protein